MGKNGVQRKGGLLQTLLLQCLTVLVFWFFAFPENFAEMSSYAAGGGQREALSTDWCVIRWETCMQVIHRAQSAATCIRNT